ncbi:MAG: putative oxidoreductase [Phycisphaerales bacterium]|nr:putative oxidoreductase [Phycisphaerales bacterium]
MPNESKPVNEAAFKELFRDEPQPVAGRGIVVTGGTTGIGRAIAMLLVARGANVLICGRHEKELSDAVAAIKRVGGGAIYGKVADTGKPDDVKQLFQAADRDLGKVDAVINNAGLAADSILDSEFDQWQQVIQTNLIGYMLCSRAAAERFRKQKNGHLINVGSMSAKALDPGSDVYVATKSAVRGFTDSLAKQLNEDGIRVTLIEPGLVGSDMTEGKVPQDKQADAEAKEKLLRAEELAHSVLYCLEQPPRCDVSFLQIRPTKQII